MIAVITTPHLGKLLHQFGSVTKLPVEHQQTYEPLVQWLKNNAAGLHPTFPGTDDSTLLTHFQLQITGNREGVALEKLLELPGIDGAYEKPMDDLPG